MNNLIINNIDHSKFDLEWAKRGGRLLCQHTSGDKTLGVLSLTGESIETGTLLYGVIYNGFNGWTVRMATPAECESAGIEYIEPPMIWRDIESAPKNQLILLLQHTLSYGDCIYSGAYVDGEWLDYTGKVHNSPHLWMPLPQPQKDEQ